MPSKRKSLAVDLYEASAVSDEDKEIFHAAWETARSAHGTSFTFYLPGMIRYAKERGRYPAVSLTGDRCELQCEHCKGRLLEPMLKAEDPATLVKLAQRFANQGALGMLLTGGADREGNLPWERFAPAIKTIRQQSALHLSAHVGFPDDRTCLMLKEAGLHQALVDVMGDDATARDIYHLNGIQVVCHALDNLGQRGLETVPHVVAGLRWGRIHGELEALEIISRSSPAALVIVVLSPLKGTPMAHVFPPSPLEVGRLIARARLLMPEIPIALGCERPRDRQGLLLERLAIRAGATRMAVWSEEAVREAVNLGLTPRFQPTCCSLGPLT